MTDLLIHDAFVLTVDDQNTVFKEGTVIVDEDEIITVRSTEPPDRSADADRVIDGTGKIVMPGLINAHAHLEPSALRGLYSDIGYEELLVDMIVLCRQLVDTELDYLAEAGFKLAALNFIRSGITTVSTMDIRPEIGVPVLGEAGMRATMGPMITDLFWDEPAGRQLDRAESFVRAYHDTYDGRVRGMFCPHDDITLTRDMWESVAELASGYDVRVHTHLLEDSISNLNARVNDGEDSLALLEDVGLLNDRLVVAHFRSADEEDVHRIAETGASIVHCPSVFAYWSPDETCDWMPLPSLRERDATIGLGLDDHYFHDSFDMFGEARQTRLMANHEWTANQIQSPELIRMLTSKGAAALGIDDHTGSLEPGKKSDLIVLDVDDPCCKPLTNVSSLVTNMVTRQDVELVVVDGTVLFEDDVVRTMDGESVVREAERALQRYENESGWDISITGVSRPDVLSTIRDLPKRGPAHLIGRLAYQKVKETFTF
ncbi:amidohydrolase family protein [Haloarcula amylolytica]|uniref:Cytosine deaminase-like metal-dependent hydrolase n=1 Tax=Haloarcula amylolytica JCM 13557 TaxID=1227452 RepID=M0K748_9EURY|nr:amidohydrolase family protein [Haloarcula amylolytica]EMA15979.1 cytosine deaminase-like metal-dependent hydrolase [Haloarcula amylolytica JCM 13557]